MTIINSLDFPNVKLEFTLTNSSKLDGDCLMIFTSTPHPM